MKKIIVHILIVFYFFSAWSQEKEKNSVFLDTVFLNPVLKKENFYAYVHQSIQKDSLSLNNLSTNLQENTSIFLREYGYGMLSSISLRGTSASHTQVVWNGIPINSILNGQTDLSTINTDNFNQILIKKGGSSVDFGSGAIGGVILLNDVIGYQPAFFIQNTTKLGSFKSINNFSEVKLVNEKWYSKFNFQVQQSENDYPYVGYSIRNENATYKTYNYATVLGHRFKPYSHIYFKNQYVFYDRELARTLYSSSQSRLSNVQNRNLLGFQYEKGRLNFINEIAYLYENYNYFYNKNTEQSDKSLSNVYILKNHVFLDVSDASHLSLTHLYTIQEGISAHFDKKKRQIGSVYLIWGQKFKFFKYDVKIRKDFNRNYQIPFTGSIEAGYRLNSYWFLRGNLSKNFKLPTFNDLYWQPFGNPSLQPEKSVSGELGIDFQRKNFSIHLTTFNIHSRDLIKWTPDDSQWWSPKNFTNVQYSGAEISASQKIKPWKNHLLEIKIDYTYQNAKDLSTQKLLPYTPQHVGLWSLKYQHKNFIIKYISRYNGKIYTTTSNTKFIKANNIHHVFFVYNLSKKIKIGGNIHNIFNTFYETFPSRPQPGINYNININIKIGKL